MKEKGLYFVIGGLVIAIIIVGIVMITNKDGKGAIDGERTLTPQMITGEDGAPSQEEIDAAQLVEVDGDVKTYQLPNGGNMKVKGE